MGQTLFFLQCIAECDPFDRLEMVASGIQYRGDPPLFPHHLQEPGSIRKKMNSWRNYSPTKMQKYIIESKGTDDQWY